ncbi:MAG: hypothetical protein A3G75_10515 [Verrucomicrobia bacterium RIFCSPLOWO2_12_FULL_64_8]|nr:MAG: hypothetical protein A3G75_10515 [Verrucomicrobia bacterium RIFCSPLOWO2_12_FULL_64_8]
MRAATFSIHPRSTAIALSILGLTTLAAHGQNPAASAPVRVEAQKAFIYKLTPSDRIRVEIYGEPDLSRNVRIDAQGRISLPLVDDVKVGGLTVDEAKKAIELAYREGLILRKPEVKISVEDYAPRLVTVNGQVRTPQQVSLPAESFFTVVDAIMRAGGPTDIAKLTAVTVKRTLPDGTVKVFTIDVEGIIRDKGRDRTRPGDTTLYLEPGDNIYVPERLI